VTTVEAKRRLSDWFRQWRLPLRKFLLGKVGVRTADVEDVAQEVFLRIMRYEKTELIEHPQAYLYKIASNVAAEWSIRAARSSGHEAKWLTNLPGGEQPDALLLRAQSQAEIKRALNALQPRQREVLKLYFTEELGHSAIAERTSQTLRSVRRHFARGYGRLRRELDPQLLRAFENGAMNHGRE
jgi:RNA polymerase sigma-70 factor (ECF subfamily)